MSSRRSPSGAPFAPSEASPEQAIKVVLVYPMDLLGRKEGGAETFVRDFIRHAPEDFDLEVVGVTSDRLLRPPGRTLRVNFAGRPVRFRPVIFVRDENRRGRVPVSLRFTLALLPSRLGSERAVYVFNRIEPALALRKNGNAAVGFLHTDVLRQNAPGKTEILWARFPRVYDRLERWAVRRLDAVFTTSRTALDRHARLGPLPSGRMSLLTNWVDPDVFPYRVEPKSAIRDVLRRTYPQLPLTGPWVLFVGRLQPVKAPFRAIDGFRRFFQPGTDGSLIMIGEGNLRPRLDDHIRRLGLQSRVFLLGDKRQDELSLFYRASDVLLVTSHYEADPRCVLEALGSGTPVVTTDVGEVRRVVQEGRSGWIVENAADADAIGQALGRVISSPEVFAPEACRACIAECDPRRVLPRLFDRIRALGAGIPAERKRPIIQGPRGTRV